MCVCGGDDEIIKKGKSTLSSSILFTVDGYGGVLEGVNDVRRRRNWTPNWRQQGATVSSVWVLMATAARTYGEISLQLDWVAPPWGLWVRKLNNTHTNTDIWRKWITAEPKWFKCFGLIAGKTSPGWLETSSSSRKWVRKFLGETVRTLWKKAETEN